MRLRDLAVDAISLDYSSNLRVPDDTIGHYWKGDPIEGPNVYPSPTFPLKKESPIPVTSKIWNGVKVASPSPPELPSTIITQLGLRNLLNVPTSNFSNYYITRKCCYLVYSLRLKTKFNYASLSNESIIQDQRVKDAMEQYAEEEVEESGVEPGKEGKLYSSLISKQLKLANKILNDMKASLSSTMIRITGYVLFKVFSRLFTSITVTEGQLRMIEMASRRNLPLIFVPLHRSHVDYLFVTWVLFNREIPAPLVAAGDNLRIPLFGWILRSLGGFFIKRRLEKSKDHKDIVYRALLQTYISNALLSGYNLEFFIEGGRTRTGKACLPKGGLLSVIVDAYWSGKLDDALIVPIGINYDRLPDGSFITEQLGHSKVPESFWRAVCAIAKVLSTNFGHARIDFSQPFSLKEFFQSGSQNTDTKYQSRSHEKIPLHSTTSSSSLFGKEVSDEYRKFVKALAEHIVSDAERCQAIMSTNALAWILSFWLRDGATLDVVANSITQLQLELQDRRRDTGFSGNSLDVSIHAIKLLGPSLVQVEGDLNGPPNNVFVKRCDTIPSLIELQYYSNALLPLYALDAVVVNSILRIVDYDLRSYTGVPVRCLLSYTKIVDETKKLCNILRNEFIFASPCNKLESLILESIERLKLYDLLTTNELSSGIRKRRAMFDGDDDSSDSDTSSDIYFNITPSVSNIKKIEIWSRAISPLIEAYYATTSNLTSLIDRPILEKEFVQETQQLITQLVEEGSLLYGESVAAEPIKNALKYLESEDIIQLYTQNSLRLVCLNKNYESEELLYPFIKEIEDFRI